MLTEWIFHHLPQTDSGSSASGHVTDSGQARTEQARRRPSPEKKGLFRLNTHRLEQPRHQPPGSVPRIPCTAGSEARRAPSEGAASSGSADEPSTPAREQAARRALPHREPPEASSTSQPPNRGQVRQVPSTHQPAARACKARRTLRGYPPGRCSRRLSLQGAKPLMTSTRSRSLRATHRAASFYALRGSSAVTPREIRAEVVHASDRRPSTAFALAPHEGTVAISLPSAPGTIDRHPCRSLAQGLGGNFPPRTSTNYLCRLALVENTPR